MQTKKSNNAGFSLVELIVVVAIMGLLIGGTLITYYTISSHNIDKAKGFVEDGLNEVRNRAMSTKAKNWELIITDKNAKVYRTDSVEDNNGNFSDVSTDIQGNKLPANVSVSFQQSDSPNIYSIDGSSSGYDSVSISFKLLSGEVSKVALLKDSTSTVLFTGDEAQYCDIIFKYRNRTKKIRLFYSTGKFVADE